MSRRSIPRAAMLREFSSMQDILWIGLILALLAASLGYAALCDRA